MNGDKKYIFSLCIFFTLLCSSQKKNILEIDGNLVNNNSKSIFLMKPNQDIRFDSLIEIPVINGKFYYKLKLRNNEVVQLILGESKEKGQFRTMPLFLENQKIDLTIYPEDEFEKNIVKGGSLNKIYQELKKQKDSLFKDRPFEEVLQWEQNYINQNPNLVSYYLYLEHLIYFKDYINLELANSNYLKLSKANPKHPYNDLALKLLNSINKIKIGSPFIDFSAPDINGKTVKISEKIKGKIALLDLWATWCSPCIVKSRSMIPVYNEYKDRGFTILGVAGEFNNTKKLINFLEKEKWPWLNLVELDRKNNIWQKYNINNAGGCIFLIDENGKIISIDPTEEEVREILLLKLK